MQNILHDIRVRLFFFHRNWREFSSLELVPFCLEEKPQGGKCSGDSGADKVMRPIPVSVLPATLPHRGDVDLLTERRGRELAHRHLLDVEPERAVGGRDLGRSDPVPDLGTVALRHGHLDGEPGRHVDDGSAFSLGDVLELALVASAEVVLTPHLDGVGVEVLGPGARDGGGRSGLDCGRRRSGGGG